jgi:hypothetical protein
MCALNREKKKWHNWNFVDKMVILARVEQHVKKKSPKHFQLKKENVDLTHREGMLAFKMLA